MVKEYPHDDRYISKEELEYIKETNKNSASTGKISHPWKSFMTSPAVWAIIVGNFCENWGFYTLLTQLPKFLSGIVLFRN